MSRPAKLQLPGANGSGVPWTIVVLLTLLTLLPALLLSMTPLVRLLVVFHFLRQALGTQSAPTNQTLIGLSLVLTYFLMQPVGGAIYQQAIVPLEKNQIDAWQALDRGSEPVRALHAEVRARKGCGAVCGIRQVAAAALAGRPAHAGGRSRLHSLRVEGGLPDWRGIVPAVSGDRPGGGLDYDLGGDDAVAAGGDLDADQDPAVRDGGRLEPAGGFADEEFFLSSRGANVMSTEIIVRARAKDAGNGGAVGGAAADRTGGGDVC